MVRQQSPERIKAGKQSNHGNSAYYRPELDALRFFAFLCVFSFHRMDYVPTDPVRNRGLFLLGNVGPFGVPVFFLLSAFLITELLLRERERTGRIHIQAFYMRRILRIWPLYFVAFFGLALLNHFVHGVGTGDPMAWLSFTFFAGNWYILRHGWIAGSVDPLWSISVEEQFYILIPLLAAFVGRRAVAIVSGLLLVVAYVTVLLYALHPVAGDNGEWTNSFLQFQFFSAGTLIALLLRGRLIRMPIVLRIAGFMVGFACWFTALLRFKVQSWEPHPTPTGAVFGWLLVLAGSVIFFLCALGTPSRFIPRWLAYLGRISYGLYVVHSLIFFLTFEKAMPYLRRLFPGVVLPPAIRGYVWTLVVLALSIALASLSFTYFERPFLNLKKRFTFVGAREEAAPPA
jgi:peptidoglycan/LPS O-acetylase OafA/YrhL